MQNEYFCPYCGREIKKEDVLFYKKTQEKYRDDVRGRFLKDHGVEDVDANNQFNRKYFHPSWDEEGNPINVVKTDENGFPTQLQDKMSNGLEPKNLNKKKVDDQFGADSYSYQAENEDDAGQKIVVLPNRACPHCHLELPFRFGMLPTYRISMFGCRAAGKTTYLVNLFQCVQEKLTINNLGTLMLEEESKQFLAPKIRSFEETGSVLPTPAAQGLLPIVSTFKLKGKEAFVIFSDIAGEGMDDPEYIAAHEGVTHCETLLLMIDPNMLSSTYGAQFERNHQGGHIDQTAGQVERPSLETFMATAGTYLQDFGENLKNVLCVVTKLDMLFEGEPGIFSGDSAEVTKDCGERHRDAVNLSLLRNVQKDLDNFMDRRYKKNIETMVKDTLGQDKHVALLGVSSSTIKKGAGGSFEIELHSEGSATKHRIIEPLLTILFWNGLIPGKKADGTIIWRTDKEPEPDPKPPIPPKPPKKKGLFGRGK